MGNLINWICLISVICLVLQVMIYISSEAIADVNSSIYNSNKRKNKARSVANSSMNKKVI